MKTVLDSMKGASPVEVAVGLCFIAAFVLVAVSALSGHLAV